MECLFAEVPGHENKRGWPLYRCTREGCRIQAHSPHGAAGVICHWCGGIGGEATCRPGTELMKMLHSLGIKPTSCAGECEAMRRQMDIWGEQCDQHVPEIVAHLRKAYKATSWASLTAASMSAFSTGLAFQLDWTDPIPSLIRLAIARARRQ